MCIAIEQFWPTCIYLASMVKHMFVKSPHWHNNLRTSVYMKQTSILQRQEHFSTVWCMLITLNDNLRAPFTKFYYLTLLFQAYSQSLGRRQTYRKNVVCLFQCKIKITHY